MYEQDASPVQVAHRLRVSTKSAYQWRRHWRAGGESALASKGPGGAVCQLNSGQVARLRAALEGGPAAWGWDQDQRWTLARVTTLIARLFHVRYTPARHLLPTAPPRLQPAGPHPPGRRAGHRRVEDHDLGQASRLAAATGAYVCFEDEAGQNLRPPKART